MIITELFAIRMSSPWGLIAYLSMIKALVFSIPTFVIFGGDPLVALFAAIAIVLILYVDRQLYNFKYRNPNPRKPCPLSDQMLKDIMAFANYEESRKMRWCSRRVSQVAMDRLMEVS